MSSMQGKAAFITGGNAGIGRAAAVAFAKQGANVLVAARREAEGEETVRLVNEAGGSGKFAKCDVLHEDQIAGAVKTCMDAFGRMDFAFNNAGVELVGQMVADTNADDYARIMDINVRGVILSMKHEIPAIKASVGAGGGGSIVNNASVAGYIGMPGLATYVASKHAVIGLTKVAALEMAQEGVRVNAVAPAAIQTDMMHRFTGQEKELLDQMAAMHPVGRVGQPEEVADAVVWLCSPGAAFVTAQTLPIDGGLLAQ